MATTIGSRAEPPDSDALGSVGVYGACLLAMAIALYTEPAPSTTEAGALQL